MSEAQIVVTELQNILKDADETAEKHKDGLHFPSAYKYGYIKCRLESIIRKYGDNNGQ
jgi:hypothetical protein